MTNTILYSEINAVCVLFLVLLSIKVKKSMFLQEQRRLFLRVTISNSVFLIIDAIWVFVDAGVVPSTIQVNWLLNGAYYLLSAFLGYFWFMYSETVQNSRLVREKKYHWIIALPILLLTVLTLVSFKTGWLFYIDASNHYHRGPGYFLQLLTSYGYVVFTAAKAFYLSLHTEDYRRKSELKVLATFVLPTLVAGALQVVFSGFPLLCIGNTFGILYIYLTLQEQMISLDPLTKLNNRNQLFQYLSTKLSHLHDGKKLYLLIMDVDYFKAINDQYGHVEGDHALKKVANCLMKACSNRNYFIARYGGDEFVAICELDEDASIQPFCDSIYDYLQKTETPYKLTLSIGYAVYERSIKNQQEFIDRADQELYKIKKNRP